MKNFVHLHNHSEYSMIDGVSKIDSLAKEAKKLGMPAIALTDHGCLSGCVKHYMACQKEGIKPILGMEAYITNNAKSKDKVNNQNYHLLLLAKNNIGWQNLIILSSLAYERENFYRKPRIDFEMLDKYGEGLIVSSACIAGEIADSMLKHGTEEGYIIASRIASKYRERFKDDYYLELMYHCMECERNKILGGKEQLFSTKQLYVLETTQKLAKELNIPTIVTNDVHFVCKDDYTSREIKKWVQFHGDKSKAEDSDSEDSGNTELYLKSPEIMWNYFGNSYGDGLERTLEVAEKCNVELILGSKARIRLPEPEIERERDYNAFLSFRDNEAWSNRISHLDKAGQYLTFKTWTSLIQKGLHKNPTYVNRLDYELAVITKTDFSKYFLLIYQFPKWARENDIQCGGGRGSAAGSLISFLLNITTTDPLKFDLPFELFLAAEKGQIIERRHLV